ncbi:hypothetical protein Tco_0025639 [Tanacetum coccineum]
MSSITDQQAKLDLELVPKEKRLEIGKCNGRLNPGKTQRETTFQVVLDALALTPCYSDFLITADVPEVYMHQFWDSVYKHDTFYRFKMDKRKRFKLTLEIFRDIFKIFPRVQGQDFDTLPTDEEIVSFLRELGQTWEINSLNDVVVDQMHQPWRTFAALINRSLSGKTTGLDKLRLSRAQILWETQIYGAILLESLTSLEMKETKAYKTYLGFATGATPPKKARKFKKPASPQLSIVPVSPEEPTKKSKRVKRPAKKSTKAPAGGVVIRETPKVPSSKRKEKVDVNRGKVIELLSEVALTEDIQFEEVRRKSLRDFHKTYPSGSGTVTKTTPSATKIKPSVTNEGTGVKPGVPDVTEEESSESEAESWGNDEDDSNNEQDSRSEGSDEENDKEDEDDEEEEEDEFVKTPPNDSDEEDEAKISDKAEGDKDEEMDYTTKNENPEISQVIEDAHVTLSTVPQKTEVPVTSSSHSSDLASKFLNFSDISYTDAEIISPMDVHYTPPSSHNHYHPSLLQQSTSTPPPTTKATNPQSLLPDFASVFQFNNRVSALEKDVSELKKDDPLKTQVTALVHEHLDARLGATRDEFMNYLSASITARITEQVKNQLPQILPKEVSNFALPVIQKMVKESLEDAVLAKESSQPQSSYEAAATLTEFELKKILIDKMDKSESYLAAPKHRECYEGLIKSYDLDKTLFSTYDKVYSLKRSRKDKDKDEDPSTGLDQGLKKRKTSKDAEPTKEEPEFEVADSDMPQDQEGNLGNDDDEPMKEIVSKRDWFTKPIQPQEPTDPDWNLGPAFRLLKGSHSNYAELEYDFEECYKALLEKLDWENPEGGDYPFDLAKPLPLVMSGNHQKVLVDYFFNNDLKYLQGGVSIMTYITSITKTKDAQYDLPDINMTFYGYARGMEPRYDVYSMKRILAVNQVEVMWKHGYGYLKEIVVRRAENDLYTFKEGDFLRLYINDIEDMLLLVVQIRLTNLSGDDVSDFTIALRMFTRSLVI